MGYPKFAVGEDIILISREYPQYNGHEAVVSSRLSDGGRHGYSIEPVVETRPGVWCESALRKRPSDFTFIELMDNLKQPVPAN